jgi:hypothetical protein
VASLDIAYGALGSVESTWTVVKIIPADPKKDLELDLGTETSVSSQWYDSTLVLQPDNKAAILRKVTLRDAASKELACEFDGTNPTASIMIAQRKQ